MPTIVNTYTQPDLSIGKSLEDLGNSMWGPHASTAAYAREKTRDAARNNAAIEAAQRLAATPGGINFNDPNARAALIGADNSENLLHAQRGIQSGRYGATSPQATDAYVGSGGAYSSTAAGTREGYANAREINDMTTARQQQTQREQFNNTYEKVWDPQRGVEILVPRSQASGRQVAPTKEHIVGGMLQSSLQGGGQGGFPGAPAAADPFSQLSPRVQSILGVALPEQSMVHPATGQTAISRDGGMTAILPNGQTVSATGFQPVGQETALTQARDNNVRAGAGQPLVVGNPMQSQAAIDARQTSGLGAGAQRFFNADLGSIPGVPTALKAITGSEEIGAETQRAQSRLDVRNNEARSILLASPGRQTIQAQKWVNGLLPQGSSFEHPGSEARKIPTIVAALQEDHELLRQQVLDPNTLPAERAKLAQQMHQIEVTARKFTEPPAGAAPPAVAPPAAPQPAPQPAPAAPAPAAPAQTAGNDPISQAQMAISKGVPRELVIQRLQQNGIQPPPGL